MPSGQRITLQLPSQKAVWASRYASFIREGKLVNEGNYQRGNPKQAGIRDRSLSPGGSDEVGSSVMSRGTKMGLTPRQLLRPDGAWNGSHVVKVGMEVDHIVELQVTPGVDRPIWNSMVNLEMLDQPSNGASGSQLDSNISKERKRLATETGNPGAGPSCAPALPCAP